jgi:hypothetical protein
MLEEQATDDPADEYLFFGETLSRARSDRDLSTSASCPRPSSSVVILDEERTC